MGRLTTHVLDTSGGRPAIGLRVQLWRMDGDTPLLLTECKTNADGRCDTPLLDGEALTLGVYQLLFSVAAYFEDQGHALPRPAFLDEVVVRFGIGDTDQHYHVPLLVSPYGYSTYRGS